MSEQELDLRPLPEPDRRPAVWAAYGELAAGESFVLVDEHDPEHLRDEFEAEHPGSYRWEHLGNGPGQWRIRISKLASTPLPRILCDTTAVGSDVSGAVWKLPVRERDLDSNIIQLAAGATIESHAGPDLDVLIHVLHGSGQLTTERDVLELTPGALVWLPRRSLRHFTAGPDGLRYLTVHQRRQALTIGGLSQ